MQFRDLKTQYQRLKPQMDQAVTEVMTAANFISGNQVKELEQELAEYVGVKHCVTCGSGTDALTLALKALNIGAGDAVFVPDFTFLRRERHRLWKEPHRFSWTWKRKPLISARNRSGRRWKRSKKKENWCRKR